MLGVVGLIVACALIALRSLLLFYYSVLSRLWCHDSEPPCFLLSLCPSFFQTTRGQCVFPVSRPSRPNWQTLNGECVGLCKLRCIIGMGDILSFAIYR